MERLVESIAVRAKPHLPLIARFLLVLSFLEDALRISSDWNGQMHFMQNMMNMPFAIAFLFLAMNIVTMISCSIMAICLHRVPIAVGGLLAVLIAQGIGYRLYINFGYIFRSISITGGLLLLLADSIAQGRSRKVVIALLPSLSTVKSRERLSQNDGWAVQLWDAMGLSSPKHVQLLGRILLVFLILGLAVGGDLTAVRMAVSVVGIIGCVLVIIGFKARWTAIVLIAGLCIANVVLNNWWSLHHDHPEKDVYRFEFFQTLSVLGGFLLLLNLGPGGLSLDEKKKEF